MSDVRETTRFNVRYGEPGYHYGTEPNAFLVEQRHRLKPGMKALMPGDGEGRNGVWLAEQGLEVTSFDPAEVGVAKIRRLAAERGVRIDARVGAVESWPWPQGELDLIGLFYVHLAPAIRRAAHPRMLAALRPGGIIVLEAFSPRQLEKRKQGAAGGPQEPDMLFTVEEMRSNFAGAELLILQDVDRAFTGQSHHGLCAVTQMVARRTA